MSDLTTGRIPATPADLQQPLPAVETGRPVANRETPRETSAVEWATFPLDPSLKGCGVCHEDVLGERVGIRPNIEGLTPRGQKPEGIVVRVCSNCGHVTTMGPILPALAAEWPVRNV